MQPQFVTKPAFTVVGMRIRTHPKSNEIPQLWQQHGERLGSVQHVAEPHAVYGVMEMTDEKAGVLDYMVAVAVTKAHDLPEGMTSWEIPAATYAVVETTLSAISETFDHITHKWMSASGYQYAGGPEFEYYGPEFSPHDPASTLSIYIPVRPQSDD